VRSLLAVFLVLLSLPTVAQKFVVEKSMVSFFSDAAIEDIKAENTRASGIFNAATAEIVFSVPIIEFKFDKALMREHFNEKYMETEKFPKATFQGKIAGIDAASAAPQSVRAQGKLTIHGVTKDIDVPGTVILQNSKWQMNSKFMVKLEDFNIARPQILWKNIAEEVEVTLDFLFKLQ
jgi:hypothetical protein